MRITRGFTICALLAALALTDVGASFNWPAFSVTQLGWGQLRLVPPSVAAQNPTTMMPAQSSAKAREVIDRAIAALGGPAYLQVKDVTRELRLAQFGTTGDLEGFSKTWDYIQLPDKNRTEYFKKRNIIYVYSGDKGWVMDRAGVEEASADNIEQYQDGLKKDIDNLFRFRLKEDGLIFRYGGGALLDFKQVDWVEVIDRERRQFRFAIERSTGLPMRAIYSTRDPETRVRYEETEYFSNYHVVQGIPTPMQVARERNGRKVYQAFIEKCDYNTGLTDAFFTSAALEETYNKLNKKKKK